MDDQCNSLSDHRHYVDHASMAKTDELKDLPTIKPSNGLIISSALITALWLTSITGYAYSKWPAFLTMKMNELGDFFAGAFAPLAFFWLVVAVVLQQKELVNSRKVLALQAKELAASVEAIHDQTSNFSEVEAQRAIANQHLDLDVRIRILAVGVAAISSEVSVRALGKNNRPISHIFIFEHSTHLPTLSGEDHFEEVIFHARKSINSALEQVFDTTRNSEIQAIFFHGDLQLDHWLSALKETVEWTQASENQLVRLMSATLQLEEFYAELKVLRRHVAESAKLMLMP